MRKIMGTRSSLSITIKDTSTIICNPSPRIQTKGYSATILDGNSKETPYLLYTMIYAY